MKTNTIIASSITCVILTSAAFAQENLYSENLYTVPGPKKIGPSSSLPINWTVGNDFTYDDNITPGGTSKDSSFGVSPWISAGFVSLGPQTTIDIYARLGMMYYFDTPEGMDDSNSRSRLSLDISHKVNERVQLETRNFISYELEPNYAYGYASSRQGKEHIYWQSDNSLGYRWTERLGTKTGLTLSGTQYQDVSNQDRTSWQLYNQFRYVLTPQSIATLDYRYGMTSGDDAASDSTNQFILVGVEHRFSQNTIGVIKVGAQLREVDKGSNNTSPYVEGSLMSQVNEQFRVRSFMRYGMESYDTVHPFAVTGGLVEFDEKNTLRFGLSANYDLSQFLTIFGGVDYITTQYESGRVVATSQQFGAADEDFITAHIGLGYQLREGLTGTATYTYTDSQSDISGRSYDRNRISVGLNAEF